MSSAFGSYTVGPSVYNAGDVIQRVVTEYDPTAAQDLTTSYADIAGSDHTFTPKRSDSVIVYRYSFYVAATVTYTVFHVKLLVDGTLETESETSWAGGAAGAWSEQGLYKYEYPVQSWGTSAKTMKLQAREYDSTTYNTKIHQLTSFDGAASTVYRRAVLEIQEIATTGGNHGDYDISDSDCVLIQSATASDVASVDFTSLHTDIYKSHQIRFSGLVPSVDATNFIMRYSIGGTWQTTTNTYHSGQFYNAPHVATGGYLGSSGGSSAYIQWYLGTAAYEYLSGHINFYHLGDASKYPYTDSRASSYNSGTDYLQSMGSSLFYGSTSAIDGIRLLATSGNINGQFDLYGYK